MASSLPLAGIKVLDFFWVLAGPGATRSMADHGATVVRVEATSRTDPIRTVGPFLNAKVEHETSALWWNNNAGKYGITLDLGKPEAREVALDLVRWADVVCESFSPKAMRAWGMDYEALRRIKPEIIMLSSCLMGQTGPLARFAGFGNLAAALCGFYGFVGWPDRQPSGPFSAYTDYIAPRFGLIAIMAALIDRERTGRGQYIDQAQAESALQFLAMPILETAANGRAHRSAANHDPHYAPHGVYPARGNDRWIAIACADDAQWRALCDGLGQPAWREDRCFSTVAGRREHRAALDNLIADETRRRDAIELERRLQAVSVPAHVVATAADLERDPQLAHREHFVQPAHGTLGTTWVENARFKLARTPARVTRSAPASGEHNQYVLEHLLGYDEQRILDLVAAGALS